MTALCLEYDDITCFRVLSYSPHQVNRYCSQGFGRQSLMEGKAVVAKLFMIRFQLVKHYSELQQATKSLIK